MQDFKNLFTKKELKKLYKVTKQNKKRSPVLASKLLYANLIDSLCEGYKKYM